MMIRITLLFVLSLLSTQTLSYTYDTSEYFFLDKNIGSETITPNCDGETNAFKFIDHLWGNSINEIHLERSFFAVVSFSNATKSVSNAIPTRQYE